MKHVWSVLGAFGLLSVLFVPEVSAGCARCMENRPVCENANYSTCAPFAYSKLVTGCITSPANCAWVFDAGGVSVDGTLAAVGASEAAPEDEADHRGCHGLILGRDYDEARIAQVRRDSRKLTV